MQKLRLNPEKFKTHLSQKPKLSNLELFNGDSAKILSKIKPLSIDLVVTSPPYDDLRDYNGYSFDFETIARGIERVLKPGGVVVWIIADGVTNGSETGASFKQALFFKEIGLNIHDTMIWNKKNSPYPDVTRYWQVFEYMFIFSKGRPKTVNILRDRKNIEYGSTIHSTARERDGSLRMKKGHGQLIPEYSARFNVWEHIPLASSIERTGHPAQHPIALVSDHILTWTDYGDRVLDPFMGSGTSGIAALALNRKFTGIEISEEYYNLASRRIRIGSKDSVKL